MSMKKEYVKFVVTGTIGDSVGNQVPCTGIDMALKIAREWLADGENVEIVPFTREEWASGNKPRTF